MKLENNQVFLSLVRLGIDHFDYNSHLFQLDNKTLAIDWCQIKQLAEEQGLSAIVLDDIEKLPEKKRPEQTILLQWIGEVLQEYEARYQAYEKTISEMAGFYNQHGFKMMVLKGYACSLDWPKPSHRPCGDIDIWQFGDYKNADKSVAKEKMVEIDSSHHHHTVFYWDDFMVENHFDFINVHHHKSNAEFEKILKSLAQNDDYHVEISGERVYLPSPNLHALFLLRHAMMEFASTGINLRQLLDWAFFVEKHGKEIDWVWIENILQEFGMMTLYNVFNAICVEELGFEARIFSPILYNPSVKDNVLDDILHPRYDNKDAHQSNVLGRLIFKYRRWKGNAWKRELCYGENTWASFWNGVWNHILKPASI